MGACNNLHVFGCLVGSWFDAEQLQDDAFASLSYACLPEGRQAIICPQTRLVDRQKTGMCALSGMTGWSTLSNLDTYKQYPAAPQSCVATP